MSVKQQACKVKPEKTGFFKGADVSKINICNYDEDLLEMTEGALSTQ